KKSKADTKARARHLDSRDLPGEPAPLVSAGAVLPGGLVSKEYGAGPVSAAIAHPRDRPRPAAVWISAHPCDVAPGGLDREQEARASLVSPGRTAGTYARATAQAHVSASRARAH